MQKENLIDAIHASAWQGVLAITGGGSAAVSDLLSRPGASATLLEAQVPYSETSLADWIGSQPKQACSELTARQMAMASFQRSLDLLERTAASTEVGNAQEATLFGLGASASLATNRPKKGEHRLHVAIQTQSQTASLSIEFEKGKRTRAEEEAMASHAIIALLAQVAGVHSIDLTKSPPGMQASFRASQVDTLWSSLLKKAVYGVQVDNENASSPRTPRLIFPGAFNPLHEGHREIAAIAESLAGMPVWFEISVRNVDKPPLDYLDLTTRLESLSDEKLLLTNAPTFVEKAKLYPGCQFVVGADTLQRIGQVRYYETGASERDEALATLKQVGCQFLVFGRLIEGKFSMLEDLDIPAALADLSTSVPQEAFRKDISSTEIRNKKEVIR